MADEVQNMNTEKESEKQYKPAKNKAKQGKSLGDWLKDIKGEFHKVIWPSKHELAKKTLTVVATSLIVGFVIVVFDAAFALLLNLFSTYVVK